jgi:hypothetical protein
MTSHSTNKSREVYVVHGNYETGACSIDKQALKHRPRSASQVKRLTNPPEGPTLAVAERLTGGTELSQPINQRPKIVDA